MGRRKMVSESGRLEKNMQEKRKDGNGSKTNIKQTGVNRFSHCYRPPTAERIHTLKQKKLYNKQSQISGYHVAHRSGGCV